MTKLLTSLLVSGMILLAPSAHAVFTGDVTGGGLFSDDVDTDNGWIFESSSANGVDFWTINVIGNSVLSIDISSLIDFGISIYQGAVSDDLGFAFDNDGDFIDPLSFEAGTYIAGTNGVFGSVGSSLSNLHLTNSGVYTIAVGGDLGFGAFGPYNYDMNVAVTYIPEPSSIALMFAGIAGLIGIRRSLKK